MSPSIFFFTDPPTTSLYTLSLHDALPLHPRYVRQIECFLNGTPVILTVEYSIGSFTGNLNGLMRFSQFVQQAVYFFYGQGRRQCFLELQVLLSLLSYRATYHICV